MLLSPDIVGPSITRNSGIIGEGVDMSLAHLRDIRHSSLVFQITQRLLYTKWRDPGAEPKLHLFGQFKRITKQWLDTCLVCKGGTYPALLMYQELADMACNRITASITRQFLGERPIKALLDPYNPTGSTRHVRFNPSRADRWETSGPPPKNHVDWVVLDSDWEAEFCRVAESHPKMIAYTENHNLGLEVPYRYGSGTRNCLPDFIVLVDDGHGPDDPLHLVVEIKGYRRFHTDFVALPYANIWTDTGTGNFTDEKIYVVQTGSKAVERCILMATDPGDLVLDPTCCSGTTTATVAEQWGRRWITIDTSRVALALARARIMGVRYPYYLLADSREGQLKEAEVTRTAPSSQPVRGNIHHGFVYKRVPHVTLKSIANNAEIDVIWDKWQAKLEPLREQLNKALGRAPSSFETRPAGAPRDEGASSSPLPERKEPRGSVASEALREANAMEAGDCREARSAVSKGEAKPWREWEIPRDAENAWPEQAKKLHAEWWRARIARQKENDASIAAKAEFEYLDDKPYDDKKIVRVAGPFTVESLSPHRVLGVDENDELIDGLKEDGPEYGAKQSFPQMILENLKTAGVQQAHKEDKITFAALTPWPGDLVCAEGRYMEGDTGKCAAIFIGPEFGTVQRADLVAAAREAGDAAFDALIACAFKYEAHTTEFSELGRIPVLKARMNAALHMAEDLKNTGKGNLFVIFGEPGIALLPEKDGKLRVKVNGVDVFHPQTGEVRGDGAEGIACWFIDTGYNEESFFVRHAYFLGANDPYSPLKTTLRAEINEDAWATLNCDTSRPFEKPKSGRIAVKAINHLGNEVMKVFKV
ncbi:MAG: DNA methyltransferase [Methylocella sp.]